MKRTKLLFVIGILCIFAAVLSPHAQAATVTATITGTVTSGKNCYSGTQACVFGTTSDLTGLPFTLTYTFDASQGTQTSSKCNPGNISTLYTSTISNSGSSNPGTAVLTITDSHNNPWDFSIGGGGYGQTSITSTATRGFKNGCYSSDYAYFKVAPAYGSSGYSGGSSVSAYVYPYAYPSGSLGGGGDCACPSPPRPFIKTSPTT